MSGDFFSDDFFASDFWGGGFFGDGAAESQTIYPPSIASAEAIGAFTARITSAVASITTGESIGIPSISSPSFVVSIPRSAWGHLRTRVDGYRPKPIQLLAPCIIAPDEIGSEETVGAPSLGIVVAPPSVESGESLGAPTLVLVEVVRAVSVAARAETPMEMALRIARETPRLTRLSRLTRETKLTRETRLPKARVA